MPKDSPNTPNTPNPLVAMEIINSMSPGPKGGDNKLADEFLRLSIKEMERLEQERVQKLDTERRNRDHMAAGYRAAQAQKLRVQNELCNHRKQNMHPAIVGQRDNFGHTIFMCLNCQKQWVDNLPGPLRVGLDPASVGGPI